MPRRLTVKAYAKVNLCLSVGAPITDGAHGGAGSGMHPIASWMAAVDLYDEIELTELAQGDDTAWQIRWSDGRAIDWAVSDDLAVRAAAVLGAADRVGGRVTKSIPAGGGLGGGSSDAAAVLMAVNQLFDRGESVDELRRRSAALGSDIAFFVHEGEPGTPPPPALVSGLGDSIERMPALAGPITLICPPFGCPTGAVYRTFDARQSEVRHNEARENEAGRTHAAVRTADVARAARAGVLDDEVLFNDLAEPAFAVRPELARIHERAERAAGRPVHVSGSGSTLFVLGDVDAGAMAAACPGARVVRTALI
ncbi:MAG: hypothetical protein AAF297_10550 [Planctomycetota bacterium]